MRRPITRKPGVAQPADVGKNPSPRPQSAMARDRIHDFDDPYLPDRQYPENTLCRRCGAVYVNEHWTFDDERRRTLLQLGTAHEVLCPGCSIITQRDPQGIVTLRGDYWPQHREEILNLVRNEELRAMHDNPLERIVDIREQNGALIIETTNEKLAQRIGRAVYKAHKGEIEYKWSQDNNLVRVEWSRSAATR